MNLDSLRNRLSPRKLINKLETDPDSDSGHVIDYQQYTNKQLLTIPLTVLGLALIVLFAWTVATGAPVTLGTDFTGGSELTIETTDSQSEIEASFEETPESITPIRSAENRYVVTFQSQDTRSLTGQAENAGYTLNAAQTTSAAFGSSSQVLALQGIAIAFAGMSIVIFVVFRTAVPSLAVVLSAFSDMVVPLALMNIFSIELTLGTVAGLLMVIGYSVDSDVLLTNSIIRRTGDFYESTYRAMRTGVTMTLTSLTAMIVMAITATIVGIDLLAAIGIILAFGLMTDLMNTYLMNVALLRWYMYEGVAR